MEENLIIGSFGELAQKVENGYNRARSQFNDFLVGIIHDHPIFRATKDPDNCPEGLFMDEDGQPYVQVCCRCTDGECRALIARFNRSRIEWDQRDFTDEFPF